MLLDLQILPTQNSCHLSHPSILDSAILFLVQVSLLSQAFSLLVHPSHPDTPPNLLLHLLIHDQHPSSSCLRPLHLSRRAKSPRLSPSTPLLLCTCDPFPTTHIFHRPTDPQETPLAPSHLPHSHHAQSGPLALEQHPKDFGAELHGRDAKTVDFVNAGRDGAGRFVDNNVTEAVGSKGA